MFVPADKKSQRHRVPYKAKIQRGTESASDTQEILKNRVG